MKAAHWIWVAILALPPSLARCDERPSADELLAAFEKSVGKLDRVKVEWNVKGRKGAPFDQELTVLRDGPRWKTDRLLIPIGDRPGRKTREQTLIGDEIFSVSLLYDPVDDKPRIRFGLTAFRERISTRAWSRIPCRVLFGRMAGELGSPVWTVMREAGSLELLPQTEMVGGVPTYVLKSRGKFGEHKMWLDPASGGLPRRIEVHKLPGDLFNDEQLGTAGAPSQDAESPPEPGRRGPPLLGRPHQEYWNLIDKIQIESQKGAFVITAYESEVRIVFAGDWPLPKDGAKQPLVVKDECKFRVDVEPKEFPENAFKFAVEIPNGTRVSVMDGYPLEYQGPVKTEHEWFDGTIRARGGR
jgi:hypothetical protein